MPKIQFGIDVNKKESQYISSRSSKKQHTAQDEASDWKFLWQFYWEDQQANAQLQAKVHGDYQIRLAGNQN